MEELRHNDREVTSRKYSGLGACSEIYGRRGWPKARRLRLGGTRKNLLPLGGKWSKFCGSFFLRKPSRQLTSELPTMHRIISSTVCRTTNSRWLSWCSCRCSNPLKDT